MIVVDTSAWVEFFRATDSPVDRTLTGLVQANAPLASTEIVIFETLAGARSERERRAIRAELLALPVLTLKGVDDYERAAELYRAARRNGVTPRRLNDVLMALCALDAGASVLHADRDFDHLGTAVGLAIHPVDG
jgi:predicted nucleic acid-binding protein